MLLNIFIGIKKLSLLFFLTVIISLNIHSQKKYDIGIISKGATTNYSGTNLVYLNNLNLEFRNQLNEKWRLNFGISAGSHSPQFNDLYSISDTSITYRKTRNFQSIFAVRAGLERSFNKQFFKNPIFKNRVFSYGFDILLGRRRYETHKYNLASVYDSIHIPLPRNPDYQILSNHDFYYGKLINAAFQFSLKANFPINKRLTFSITNLYSLEYMFKLKDNYDINYLNNAVPAYISYSSITNDPNIPLFDVQTLRESYFVFFLPKLYFGLRYSFGKKKNDIEVLEE